MTATETQTVSTRYPVRIALPVRWGDMDALGHVNNTEFFRWFECARIRYMEALGRPVVPGTPTGPILASTSCRFLAPVFYPDEVEVRIGAVRLGRKSFALALDVQARAGTVAEGEAVMVWYDYRAGSSIPLDAEIRSRMLALEEGAAIDHPEAKG